MSAYSQASSNIRKTWLLLFLFVGVVSGLCYAIGYLNSQPFVAIFGVILSIGQAFFAYFFGDKLALFSAGAKEVSHEEAPQIHTIVENLCVVADIPKPKIFVSPDPSPNAFACGRDPKNASICLNQGILTLLDKNELEGVIAHELSHIKNRDILVMTVTMVLASVVTFITDIGLRLTLWGGNNRDRDSNSPVKLIIYLAVIILAPLVALLIQLAVSRSREYLADASAVTLTRYPEGLVNALQKLYANPIPSQNKSSAMSHFYISPPKRQFGEKANEFFSTHPSIEKRIAALSKM